MAKFTIETLDKNSKIDYKKWINFLNIANGATIFHHPEFLKYHGNRFNDFHLVIYKGDKVIGIASFAIFKEENKTIIKSPYGASYGGFVFKEILTYSHSKEIANLFIEYIKNMAVNEIRLTPPLPIYHKKYSDTFIFALMEKGFRLLAWDITSVVNLKDNNNIEKELFTSNIRNTARKAKKFDIKIKYKDDIDNFWIPLEKTYEKHKKAPTHTKEEYRYLMDKFPDKIYCNVAYLDDKPIASMGVFVVNEKTIMSFYLGSDLEYKHTQALSLLVYETLIQAKKDGFDYFDFGTSSINMVGKENIFRFKEQFGAIGVFRNSYLWKG